MSRVWLQNAHFLPGDRLAELFLDVFRILVSAAMPAGWRRLGGIALARPSERLVDWIVHTAEVKHLNETNNWITGRTQWLPGLRTAARPVSRTDPRRGDVLEGLGGCLVVRQR